MRIFKSKTFKRGLSLFVLVTLLLTGNLVLGELLTPISYATYFNHDLKLIEEREQQADMVFVGASRMYRAFVPQVLEDALDMDCVINAASSAQPISAGYHQLKDLIKRFKPKTVVIDITWGGLTREPKLQSKMLVYDRLSFAGKLGYVADCFEGEELLYTLRTYRFRNNLKKISKIYTKKQKLVQSDYTPDTDEEEYYGDTGFIYNKKGYENGTIPERAVGTWKESNVIPESRAYLDACIELCKENDIKVILVTAPTSMMRLYKIGNYQDAYEYYCEYAKEKGVDYYNLNYLVNREEFLPDAMMCDDNHVNGEGAYIISEIFAEILAKEEAGIDTSDYFYKNLDELKTEVHRVVALNAEITLDEGESGFDVVDITSLQNEDVNVYYQLELSLDGGQTYDLLVDWVPESHIEVNLPEEKGFKLKISAKSDNAEEAEAYQICNF